MMSKLLFRSSTVYLSLSPGVLSIVVLAVNLPFPTFVSSFRVTEVFEGFVYFRFLSLRPLFRLFDKFETCFFVISIIYSSCLRIRVPVHFRNPPASHQFTG